MPEVPPPPEPEPLSTRPPEPSWTRVADGAEDVTLEENWLFRLRRERFRSRISDLVHDFYVMYLADAVHAIALTPDDRMVLVRQFRAASQHDSLEPPGGLLQPGEDPRAAGARELLEETGYAGDPPILLGTLWSNPSILTSRTTTIVITNARRVAEPTLDHIEEVAIELVPVRDIPRLIREGAINHALCVAGLLWWLQSHPSGTLGAGED
jgi:8-oxo-dGTP pyrophosphatase MutT (NUDIX family)